MLTNQQIKHLRALAHPLNAVLQTGANGLTDACELVHYIGKTVVLFKRNSNHIKIELPKG